MTPDEARDIAHELDYLHKMDKIKNAIDAIMYLADQVEFLIEQDTISDSRISLAQELTDQYRLDANYYKTRTEELTKDLEFAKEQIYFLRSKLTGVNK